MTELLITVGCPASGKTTWANELVHKSGGSWMRVNRDDLRLMLKGGRYEVGGPMEDIVTVAAHGAIRDALKRGINVVCDDTNATTKVRESLAKIAAEEGAAFAMKKMDASLKECIRRDVARERSVGEDVVRKIWQKIESSWGKDADVYASMHREQYIPDVTKPRAVIVDIDGTVALMNGRGPFEWHRVGEDLPNEPVISVVRALAASGYKIIFTSGRDAVCRQSTFRWLQVNVTMVFDLYMRPEQDSRNDSIIKAELFELFKDDYNVELVLDDRDSVVRLWRDMGFVCLQVAPGDF